MSRWHEPTCSNPEVEIIGGLPYCVHCDALATLDDIEDGLLLQGPREPPSEKSGTFNLTWPSCVQYIGGEDPPGNGSLQNSAIEVPELLQTASPQLRSSAMSSEKQIEATGMRNNEEDGSMVPRPCFRYQPLPNRKDVRLLKLNCGNDGSPLHADFATANLESEDTSYNALSYTWADDSGNTDRCRPLFVGPFWDALSITRNCEQALRSVRRRTGKPLDIWVDSVCINQADADERSCQVALMTEIYSRATEVMVYLGPAKDNSALALAASTRSLLQRGCVHAPSSSTGICEACSEAIRLLLQRPYFHRLWVVQEFVLSKQVSIYCGTSYAILRPNSEPGTFTMVCACDLMLNLENYHFGSLSVKPIGKGEKSQISSEWDRIMRKLESQIGATHTAALAAGPKESQLLDIARSLPPLSETTDAESQQNFWHHHEWAEQLWSKWKRFESRLGPLLRNAESRLAIKKAFMIQRLTFESCPLRVETDVGIWVCGCDTTGCTRGLLHISKLLWSLLSASVTTVLENDQVEADRPLDEHLSIQFMEWATTTEQLFSRLVRCEELGISALARATPGEGVGSLWMLTWNNFLENSFPLMGVSDMDSVNAIDRLLDFRYSSPHQKFSWNWDGVRDKLDTRWKFWKILDEDEWMRRWRKTRGEYTPGLSGVDYDLAVRLEMGRLGFNLDDHENVEIR
ncbi:heterokaryon incompatibility protein [Colletotrichum sojae]|uniref:Heterokaryon incompatibility protein n=1 Tax=Colletotrichum sojae TaxID=2175907 RepID=A0A8H6MQI6_9PEZI|nr:heterokaryon incompatibility protein [Colletotrichum sojae]